MRIRYLPIAVDELERNAHWLDEHAHGRGGEFLDAYVAAIEKVLAGPRQFPRFEAALELVPELEIRRCTLKPFPHLLLFEFRVEVVLIVAIMHPSQRPDYWLSRLK